MQFRNMLGPQPNHDGPTLKLWVSLGCSLTIMINETQAIELAREEASARRCRLGPAAPTIIRKDRHMRLDRKSSGWVIVFALDVPQGLEPNTVVIEVYDDGRVFTPDNL